MPRISPRTIDEMSIGEFASAISLVLRGRTNILNDGASLDGPIQEPTGNEDVLNDDEIGDDEEDDEPDNEGTAS